MPLIRESDLPGIGRKFEILSRSGDKLVIVVHDDGRREMYHFAHEDPEDSISMISLDDPEARQVAGILGGITYKPKALETIEIALDDVIIEWYKIEPGSACIGKTIGEMHVRKATGATIIAVIEADHHHKQVNPGPEVVLTEGATIVVVGERDQIKCCKRLVYGGSV